MASEKQSPSLKLCKIADKNHLDRQREGGRRNIKKMYHIEIEIGTENYIFEVLETSCCTNQTLVPYENIRANLDKDQNIQSSYSIFITQTNA